MSYNLPWDFPANDKEFNDPEAIIVTGIAVDYDRIFVATPRLYSGVPATISTVARKDVGDSPALEVINHSIRTYIENLIKYTIISVGISKLGIPCSWSKTI